MHMTVIPGRVTELQQTCITFKGSNYYHFWSNSLAGTKDDTLTVTKIQHTCIKFKGNNYYDFWLNFLAGTKDVISGLTFWQKQKMTVTKIQHTCAMSELRGIYFLSFNENAFRSMILCLWHNTGCHEPVSDSKVLLLKQHRSHMNPSRITFTPRCVDGMEAKVAVRESTTCWCCPLSNKRCVSSRDWQRCSDSCCLFTSSGDPDRTTVIDCNDRQRCNNCCLFTSSGDPERNTVIDCNDWQKQTLYTVVTRSTVITPALHSLLLNIKKTKHFLQYLTL